MFTYRRFIDNFWHVQWTQWSNESHEKRFTLRFLRPTASYCNIQSTAAMLLFSTPSTSAEIILKLVNWKQLSENNLKIVINMSQHSEKNMVGSVRVTCQKSWNLLKNVFILSINAYCKYPNFFKTSTYIQTSE